MAESQRDRILTGLAICFWLLAISNFSKPFQLSEQTGFVLFGARLTGGANVLWSLVFGAYLVVYGLGIWHMKRFVVGMAHAYALYVVLNLFLYWSNNPQSGGGDVIFAVLYSVVAVGASVGSAVLLSKRRKELSW
jgi:predicted membrane-bound spermidine synthase